MTYQLSIIDWGCLRYLHTPKQQVAPDKLIIQRDKKQHFLKSPFYFNQKHALWVLKIIVSMWWLLCAPRKHILPGV